MTELSQGWNFAEIWEHLAERFPDESALVHGDRVITWREFDRRADGIAASLLAGGAGHQDKVAQYLYNCPEYLESMFGMFKAGLVPVNTNYRYTEDEIHYLWSNADAVAVVFHGVFTEMCAALRGRLPAIRTWIWVDDGSGPCPPWAVDYEAAAASASGRVAAPWGRSPDDVCMLYTGGTTGMPKGVMWRQDDMFGNLDSSSRWPLPAVPGWDAFDERMSKPGPRSIPAAPLMHGAGLLIGLWNLSLAGTIITLPGRRFSAVELLDTIEAQRANGIGIVGDAFAKPMLAALDAEPDRWDISSLRVVSSSGVMWSAETKAGFLRHNPRLILLDSLGSSEAIGVASTATTSESSASTATFTLGPNAKVLADDGSEVLAGSGRVGRLALRGRTPVGYYKDPERSAATFVTINGERWSIPGDYAEVDADGTAKLLGRGSQCINTGGEKVYPEEVEEALKLHPDVADAAVVGIPDERFGQAITAIVEPRPGADVHPADLIQHVKSKLAAYKAPKHVVPVDTIGRAPNGKLDYKRLTAVAVAAVDDARA